MMMLRYVVMKEDQGEDPEEDLYFNGWSYGPRWKYAGVMGLLGLFLAQLIVWENFT